VKDTWEGGKKRGDAKKTFGKKKTTTTEGRKKKVRHLAAIRMPHEKNAR